MSIRIFQLVFLFVVSVYINLVNNVSYSHTSIQSEAYNNFGNLTQIDDDCIYRNHNGSSITRLRAKRSKVVRKITFVHSPANEVNSDYVAPIQQLSTKEHKHYCSVTSLKLYLLHLY
jgi:hypothetical protein